MPVVEVRSRYGEARLCQDPAVFALFTLPVVLACYVTTLAIVGSIWWWGVWLRRCSSARPLVWRTAYLVFVVGVFSLGMLLPTLPSLHYHPCGEGEYEGCVDPPQFAKMLEQFDLHIAFGAIGVLLVTALWMLFATWKWHWGARAVPAPAERAVRRRSRPE